MCLKTSEIPEDGQWVRLKCVGAILNKKKLQQAGIKRFVYDKVARKMYNIQSVQY